MENDVDDLKTTLEAEKRSNNVKASEWRTDFRISYSSKHVIKYKIVKTVENNENPSLRKQSCLNMKQEEIQQTKIQR